MADTQQVSRMLLEAFRVLDADVAGALEARGVSDIGPRHATAILLVDRKGVRLTDMAERASITKQAMMQVVDDLESMGHVRRVSDPTDARAKLVTLTAKGQRERSEAAKAVASAEVKVRRQLGGPTYDALKAALETIVA